MTQEQKIIRAKLGLLELAKQLGKGRDKRPGYDRLLKAQATHDRPRAPFSEDAPADARCCAIGEAVGRVRATITRCVPRPPFDRGPEWVQR